MIILFVVVFIVVLYIMIMNLIYLYNWLKTENKLIDNLNEWEKEERKRLQK